MENAFDNWFGQMRATRGGRGGGNSTNPDDQSKTLERIQCRRSASVHIPILPAVFMGYSGQSYRPYYQPEIQGFDLFSTPLSNSGAA